MRIGVIGGTFDPIHYGHLILAEHVKDQMFLDKVIFMPAKVSPFKLHCKVTEPQQRLTMTHLATDGNPGFFVSDLEVKSNDISYTIHTLRKLQKELTAADKIYFITGTDVILEIERWKGAKELLTEFAFIIGTRPGYRDDELMKHAEHLNVTYGTDVTVVQIPKVDISSTGVRNNLKLNKSIRYLLPESVEAYINANNLYENFEEFYHQITEYVKGRLTEKRYLHTLGTVETAVALAEAYDVSIEKTKIAAMFHDVCKNVTIEKMNEMIDLYGLDPKYKNDSALSHSKLAACVIADQFLITDESVINAIRYHTTGRENMSLLEKIIYIADATEPTRTYKDASRLNELAFVDIDAACYEVLQWNVEKLEDSGSHVDEDTIKALKWLRKEFYEK